MRLRAPPLCFGRGDLGLLGRCQYGVDMRFDPGMLDDARQCFARFSLRKAGRRGLVSRIARCHRVKRGTLLL